MSTMIGVGEVMGVWVGVDVGVLVGPGVGLGIEVEVGVLVTRGGGWRGRFVAVGDVKAISVGADVLGVRAC